MSQTPTYLRTALRHAVALGGPGTQGSILLHHHGALVRASTSDVRAGRCDEVTLEVGGPGPARTALAQHRTVRVAALAVDGRWPRWQERAVAAGFTSALVTVGRVAPGMDVVLTLYAETPLATTAPVVDTIESATRALTADVRTRTEQARPPRPPWDGAEDGPGDGARDGSEDGPADGLVDRAVGAAMQLRTCGPDEALRLLLVRAMRERTGLTVTADRTLRALAPAPSGR